jgi:hypothetical protein
MTSTALEVRGRTTPRLWTRPEAPAAGWAEPSGRVCPCGCGLSESTSKGWSAIDFATMLGVTLLAWQVWLFIHALELREDGRYRFRTVLVKVSRQNGKTTALKVLSLWRMWCDGARMVLGTSTSLEYAKEPWQGAAELALDYDERHEWPDPGRHGRARDCNWIFDRADKQAQDTGQAAEAPEEDGTIPGLVIPGGFAVAPSSGRRRKVGTERAMFLKQPQGALDASLYLTNGARYKVAVAGRKGGRSLSVDLGIADELREHKTWEPWSALSGATTARPDSQLWALSNEGDDTSIVLNDLSAQAAAFIETGEGDPTLAVFEWSAPPGCELDDVDAIAQANPALGETIELEFLLNRSRSLPSTVYRTEHLCQRIARDNPAIDPDGWEHGKDLDGTMDGLRERVHLCIDVAPESQHVALVAAAVLEDGRARVEPVAAWPSVDAMRAELPDLVARIKPRALGWFPNGPGAVLARDLEALRCTVTPIKAAEVPSVCQGLGEFVSARRLLHPGDPLLTGQALGAVPVPAGDGGWRFARRGDVGQVNAVYAAAGALHLARGHANKYGKRRRARMVLPTAS